MDRNDYYGGESSSLNLNQVNLLIDELQYFSEINFCVPLVNDLPTSANLFFCCTALEAVQRG